MSWEMKVAKVLFAASKIADIPREVRDTFLCFRFTRMHDKGRKIAASGNTAKAFQTYVNLFEQSRTESSWSGVRASFLLSDMMKIANQNAAAMQKMYDLRNRAEERVKNGVGGREAVNEWDALNNRLNKQRTLDVYEELISADCTSNPTVSEIRSVKFGELVSQGKYADFTDEELAKRFLVAELMSNIEQQFPHIKLDAETQKYHREFVIANVLCVLECAANKGLRKLAERSYELLLTYADSGEFYAEMIRAVTRASNRGFARRIVGDAKAALPEEQLSAAISAAHDAGIEW